MAATLARLCQPYAAVIFTFAVIGHDEAELLPVALDQALAAAGPGDAVVFVDSGSSDGSADVARRRDMRVLSAPAGKGRAMALALGEAESDYVVFVDADIRRSATNIPAALRAEAERTRADLVVGDIDWPERPLLNTRNVYRPLVGALFPEAIEPIGSTPFSGFRALRTAFDWGALPPGFGVETHLNLRAVGRGGAVALARLGRYEGPVRPKPLLGREVGAAILDAAVELGRLAPERRPEWEEWLERVVAAIAAGDVDRAARAGRSALPPAVVLDTSG